MKLNISLLAVSIALCSTSAFAEPADLLDQVVSVSFEPKSVHALIAEKLGEVKQREAVAVRIGDGSTGVSELLVGSPLDRTDNTELAYSFFLKSRDNSFAATPVRLRTQGQAQAIDAKALQEESANSKNHLIDVRRNYETVSGELASLRSQAAKIVEIDDIIDLKSELSGLKGFGEQKSAEKLRLQALIERGRKQSEPTEADERRQDLSDNLRDAARVTAMADRLRTQRKESAKATFQRKLALVREMSRYNPEELAREILKLRTKRKNLEANRGSEPESAEDEF